MKDTPINEDLDLKQFRKFLLAHPYLEKSERGRVMKSEKYSDDLKSLLSMYPVKRSKP